MTINATIALARSHLAAGNAGAYERIMSHAIRAALSTRAVNAYRAAMRADGMEE